MSGNTLKLIALISMTIDHVGLVIFPEHEWMRIVGRIAFPIFAFMIAESCKYTRDRTRYLLQIAIMAVFIQIVVFIAIGSLYQSVFTSFTLAIILIYAIDKAVNERSIMYWVYALLYLCAIAFLCFGLPKLLVGTDYAIDYSIVGVLIPAGCYFAKSKILKLFVFCLELAALSLFYGGIQWFCLLAVPLIALYNYQKGRLRLKNLFYVYYPVHLTIIYAVGMII